MTRPALPYTADEPANRLLATDPLALLIGMLLDQQIPMEKAFRGPYELQERLGEPLDAAVISALDPDSFAALFQAKPALHRFPGSMAKRTQTMCRFLMDEYEGDAAAVWSGVAEGTDLFDRLRAIPGFGDEKSRILIGVLGRRLGIRPSGWEGVQANFPSIADVEAFADMAAVRERKRAYKAARS